jgi:hypothetical protein
MALQRDARYPGRWTAASGGHPQGAFKNRTAPGSLDGSYIEQDWANDWDGYFSSLLSAASITPNGNVDAVGASQYYSALALVIKAQASGRLIRTTIYRNNAGTLQASVDGGAYANVSSTFTKHPDAVFAEGEVLGGGASGANAALTGGAQVSAGPGGGGGGWSFIRRPIASFNGVTITVGAGGTASANQAGASSAIGALITATGGVAVSTGAAASATNIPFGISDGGVGSGGDINSNGGVGQWALYSTTPQSGTGGGSKYGFGPTGVGGAATTGTLGNNAVSPGTGGSGAACGNSVAAPKAGGAGAAGLVIIREYQ